MTKMDLEEAQDVEFEEKFSSKFLKKVVGLVNSGGGSIYLGIRDDKEIVGIKITTKLKESIQDSCNKCKNPIPVGFREEEMHGKTILVVGIPRGEFLPYMDPQGIIWIRTGAVTRKTEPKEVSELVASRGYIRFEKQRVVGASIDDIDKNKVRNYLEKLGKPSNVSLDKVLLSLDLAVKDNGNIVPTVTGILMFDKNAQKFIPHSRVNIARYDGITRVRFLDRAEITGTIFEIIEETEKFIRRNTRLSSQVIGFERIDFPEYPYPAIRESIVNAVAHREYAASESPIQVSIFDDRIEIINPGIPNIPINELEKNPIHQPRNIIICQILNNARYMEGFGTGIERMRELMEKHGLKKPLLEIVREYFKVTFFGPKEDILKLVKPKRLDLKQRGLNDRQIKALAYMYDKGGISHREYCALFEVTNFVAMKELESLIEGDLVERVGKGVESYYKPMK